MLVAVVACACLAVAGPACAASFVKGDVSLTLRADGQVKVTVVAVDASGAPVPTTARITCGTSKVFGAGGVVTDASASVHKLALPGLATPNARYFYDVTLTANGETLKLPSATTRYSFLSPPGPAADFTISIFGDTRPHSPGQKQMPAIFGGISKDIAASGSDLALGVGDYTYIQNWGSVDTRAMIDQRYEQFFGLENQVATAMPTMLATGNHEELGQPDFPQATDAWRFWFDFPGGENRYYSFDWGRNVHIVVFDETGGPLGFAGDGESGNSAQAQWLIDDLEANARPWVIVVDHVPLFHPESGDYWASSWGSTDPLGVAERDRLAAFFDEMGVDAVFAGHQHQYCRHMQDGIAYVTQGGGGAPLYSTGPGQADAYDVVYYSEHGYSTLQFDNKGTTAVLRSYKVLDAAGAQTLGDSWTLQENPRQ
jgi:Calcineurin-like phosphoesterase